jgi:lipoyl(octanoyl) transferase
MPEFTSIADAASRSRATGVAVDFYLLGQVPFEQYLSLQRRLAYELGGDPRTRIVVLFCEHEPQISIGRGGSRGHIQWTGEELRHRQLAVQWVSRGGGCVLHGPGQLSVYALVPLDALGWHVGDYLQRLQQGLWAALRSLSITVQGGQHDLGLWGRTGQLACMGVAVRNGITLHGMFVNVNPAMNLQRAIYTPHVDRGFGIDQRTMGCLVAERSQGTKMTSVRSAIIEHLPAAFDSDRYNVFSGHPLMPGLARDTA